MSLSKEHHHQLARQLSAVTDEVVILWDIFDRDTLEAWRKSEQPYERIAHQSISGMIKSVSHFRTSLEHIYNDAKFGDKNPYEI